MLLIYVCPGDTCHEGVEIRLWTDGHTDNFHSVGNKVCRVGEDKDWRIRVSFNQAAAVRSLLNSVHFQVLTYLPVVYAAGPAGLL